MIPHNWTRNFAFFITYFGDVYFGFAVEANSDFNSNDFFIIGKNQFNQYNALGGARFNRENLEKIGQYIPNYKIIQEIIPEEQFPNNRDNSSSGWSGNPSDYKKMYVFGAGASANCLFGEKGRKYLTDSHLRPPLGPELFAERFDTIIKKYSGLKLMIPRFEAKGNDIEAIMEDDWGDLMTELEVELAAQHVQVQFFLQELFGNISHSFGEEHFRYNLATLFTQNLFRKWKSDDRPTIVSFNYDSILENAIAAHLRIPLTNPEHYLTQGKETKFLFFKPHGSWNWGWEFDKTKITNKTSDIPRWLYENHTTPATIYYSMLGSGMLSTEGWGVEMGHNPNNIGKITPNKNKIKVIEPGKSYFPALLLPYRDKDDFVLPYSHQLRMEYTIDNIEELVLIGWKGNENLFNSKLKKRVRKLKKITIANPDVAGVKKELGKYLDIDNYEVLEVRNFEDYVLNYMK